MAIKVNGTTVIDDSRNISSIVNLTATGNAVFSTTSHMQIPSGTTAQRPGTNTAGFMRFNTTTGSLEINNGTSFSAVGGAATGSDIYNAYALGAL